MPPFDSHSPEPPQSPELPSWEIQLSRLSILSRAFIYSSQGLLQQINWETEELLRIYDEDESYDVFQPYLIPRISGLPSSNRHWSIAMILEHLSLATFDYARIIESLNKGVTPRGMFDPQQYWPTKSIGTEVREQFLEAQNYYVSQIESVLKSSGRLNAQHRFSHVWFGPLKSQQWHALVGQRLVIHRRQAQKIIALMGVA